MYEVELKVRADHGAVRDQLATLDATHVETVVQEDTYYDAPHRDFAETDEALRVRRESTATGESGDDTADDDAVTRLTYKGPLVEAESKTREEAETAVEDPDATADILAGIGFEPAATVRKERDRYAVGEYAVVLDEVDGLGTFVEVETEVSGESEVESAREGATDLLERLGLDPEEGIRTSYLGLLLESPG